MIINIHTYININQLVKGFLCEMWHFKISPPWDSNEGYISKCVLVTLNIRTKLGLNLTFTLQAHFSNSYAPTREDLSMSSGVVFMVMSKEGGTSPVFFLLDKSHVPDKKSNS